MPCEARRAFARYEREDQQVELVDEPCPQQVVPQGATGEYQDVLAGELEGRQSWLQWPFSESPQHVLRVVLDIGLLSRTAQCLGGFGLVQELGSLFCWRKEPQCQPTNVDFRDGIVLAT